MKNFYCFSGSELWSLDSKFRPLTEDEFAAYFDCSTFIPFNGDNYLVDLDECTNELPVAGYLHDIRSLLIHEEMRDEFLNNSAASRGYLEWYRNHRFCGRCGKKNDYDFREKAAVCTVCGASFYPRVSPCVIVLVYDGKKVLLANNVKYRTRKLYSILAGYVDPGESLEEAVHREIKEETGIEVDNLKYQKSQSWPFPQQLMIAYTAQYKSGIIRLQEDELTHAAWFDLGSLPEIPGKGSVAGQLIREFLDI